jgi:hypothetical protein
VPLTFVVQLRRRPEFRCLTRGRCVPYVLDATNANDLCFVGDPDDDLVQAVFKPPILLVRPLNRSPASPSPSSSSWIPYWNQIGAGEASAVAFNVGWHPQSSPPATDFLTLRGCIKAEGMLGFGAYLTHWDRTTSRGMRQAAGGADAVFFVSEATCFRLGPHEADQESRNLP